MKIAAPSNCLSLRFNFFIRVGAVSLSLQANLCRSEKHVVRAAQLESGEVEIKGGSKFLAVPPISAHELFVVLAKLVPAREQRTREVKALPVPALRHHVHLFADV